MDYKTQFLGPLFTAVGGFILGYGANIITLLEALNGIQAVSVLMLSIMAYKWSDVQ